MASADVPEVEYRDTERLIPGKGISLQDKPVDRSKEKNGYLFFVVLLVLQAPLIMGYAIGFSSPALPKIDLNDTEGSWFGSLLNIGAILGGPIAGFLLQSMGRKVSIMACALPFVAGWVLIGTASNKMVALLYTGRVLTGVACGMTSLAVPNYISEVAPPSLRGFLGSSFQVSVTVGILLVYCLGIPLTYYWLALTGAAMTGLLVVTMLGIPETPRFLLIKHFRVRAIDVLSKLRGPLVDVDQECREVEDALDNSDDKFSWSEFTYPFLYKPLIISLALMFFQQFSGINAVMFYTVNIFNSAAPSIDSNIATVIVGVVQVVFTCVAAVLMDRMGRKALLVIGAFGMAISCTTFGLYYQLTEGSGHNGTAPLPTPSPAGNNLSWLPLTSIIVYIISFSLAWGPIPWLVMSEIFPSKAKGVASGIATAFNWTCSFIVTKEFNDMQDAMTKKGIFWFYGGVSLLGALFVIFFVPETKGRSLEEIEASFAGNDRRSK